MRVNELQATDLIASGTNLTKSGLCKDTGAAIEVAVTQGQVMGVTSIDLASAEPHFTASYLAKEAEYKEVTITFNATDANSWVWLRRIPGLS